MQKVALVLSCLACSAHARGAAKKGKPLEVLASLLRANSYYPAAPSPRGFGDADASAYDAWAREAGAIPQGRTGTDVRGVGSGRIQNVRGVAGGRMSWGPEESTRGPQHGGDVFDWEAQGGAVPRNSFQSYPPGQPGNRNVGFEWATETGATHPNSYESRMARQPGGDVFDGGHHAGQFPPGGASQVPRDPNDPWMIAKEVAWAQGRQAAGQPHHNGGPQNGMADMQYGPRDEMRMDWAQGHQSAGQPPHNGVPQTAMADMQYLPFDEMRMRRLNEQGKFVKTAVSGALLAAAACVLYMHDPQQNLLAEWGDKLTNLVEYMQDPKQNLLAEWGNKLTNLVDTFTP